MKGFLVLLAAGALALRAQAGALNPLSFSSLGAASLTASNYFLDSSGPAPRLMDASSNTLFTGTFFVQDIPAGTNFWGWDPVVAVFDFDSVYVQSNATVTMMGTNPVALLSRSTFVINGILDASGTNGHNGTGDIGGTSDGMGGPAGPGGGAGGSGGSGSPPTSTKGEDGFGPGGGNDTGAYGGTGGNGSRGNGAGFGGRGGGGFGGLVPGSPYGDLHQYLQGGAGGGGTGTDAFLSVGAGGGGGGGGLEIGAVTSITLGGRVLALGGSGGGGATVLAGGASGGGVFVHAPLFEFTVGGAEINASGGDPNGAGGRILILTNTAPPVNGTLAVAPGASGGETGDVEFGLLGAEFGLPRLTITLLSGPPAVDVCWPTFTNINYQLETNTSLSSAAWGAFGAVVLGNGGTNCVEDSVSSSRVFYRVRVITN